MFGGAIRRGRDGAYSAFEVDVGQLHRVMTSPFFLFNMLWIATLVAGIHLLATWGSLSGWGSHRLVDVCLYKWNHPSGYGALMAQDIPISAFVTTFCVL